MSIRRQQEKEADKQKLLDLYQQIWNEEPHISDVSGISLGKEIKTTFFHHILPKNSYPIWKFDKRNIALLTPDEHNRIEYSKYAFESINKRREELLKTKPDEPVRLQEDSQGEG